ncbi:HMCN1 [Branchiostoma lanceolatum]|uniref:HMCN1 protein n=1 Tax=Branchiostoma lanceolatum TaxID=7740 RepID=A0A8J9YU64_BRALA|nr:HMCN1 [Branchiostoma lanceolatum]
MYTGTGHLTESWLWLACILLLISHDATGAGVGLKVPKTVNGIMDERVTLPATYDSTETVISITWSKVVGGMGGERKMVYIYSPNLEYSHGPLLRRAQLVGKASLEINETKLEDEGLYVITVVLNIVGQEEKYVRLNVMVRPTVLVGPEDPYIVRWDTSVSLTCTVVNAKPNITSLRWERNGVSLSTPSKKYGGGSAMLPTLNIQDVTKMDAGTYTCVVDHVTDTVKAGLMLQILYPATIQNISKSATVDLSGSIKVKCFAEGNPEPEVTWSRAGTTSLPGIQLRENGANVLSLSNLQKNDSGEYTCTVTNGLGVAQSKSTRITVKDSGEDRLSRIAVIAGASVGTIWFVTCVVIAVIFIRKRTRQEREKYAFYYGMGSRMLREDDDQDSGRSPRRGDMEKGACQEVDYSTIDRLKRKAGERGNKKFARVLYNYAPQDSDELKLEANDVIEVIKGENGGWWFGYLKGKVGLFPSNYVELVSTPPVHRPHHVARRSDREELERNVQQTLAQFDEVCSAKKIPEPRRRERAPASPDAVMYQSRDSRDDVTLEMKSRGFHGNEVKLCQVHHGKDDDADDDVDEYKAVSVSERIRQMERKGLNYGKQSQL